jgi:acyl-CoA hydrolase
MRSILWLLPVLLFAVLGCGERKQLDALPPEAVVLAFGDSVTAGVGADAGYDFPSQLAQLTDLRIVNGGVSGDTAREAGGRLAALLASHQPQLVIIELGGNDFLRQTQASRVKEYLRAMIREALASGATVALVAVPRLSLLRASVGALTDSPIYAELAEEEGLVLVPNIFSEVLSDSGLRADEIHPNARGYGRLAQGIKTVLTARGLLTD